jgi:hypothetical protein
MSEQGNPSLDWIRDHWPTADDLTEERRRVFRNEDAYAPVSVRLPCGVAILPPGSTLEFVRDDENGHRWRITTDGRARDFSASGAFYPEPWA